VSETDRQASSAAQRQECAKRWHYWFAFWLRSGYTVTCTRCGETVTK